jgi:ribosomal protein L29
MDVKTLRAKPVETLKTDLKESHEHLMALGFKIAANQLKNVREVRKTKLAIARMQTLLREKRS